MRGDVDQVADVRNRRASIFLPINPLKTAKINNPRMIRHLVFIYFEMNNGVLYVLDYVEDIHIRVLSFLVSILNPNHMYLPLLFSVLYQSSCCHKSNSFVFVLNTFYDYGIVVPSTPSDPRTNITN